MTSQLTIMWFRQDLRLQDNPALCAAVNNGQVLPVYILDDQNAGQWRMGAASRWWLHQSLAQLNASLEQKLWILCGDPESLLAELASTHGAQRIVWNRCYEPWQVARDKKLKQHLQQSGIEVDSYNASLLWEPWANLKGDGTPYRVFTPYYRNGLATLLTPADPVPAPGSINLLTCEQPPGKLDELALMPEINWYESMSSRWTPGEIGAATRLEQFTENGLGNYKAGRDFPALESVSGLSPHLHFGEISPNQAWHRVQRAGIDAGWEVETEHFQRELAWREFSHALLYHFPDLTERNMNARFDHFPWLEDDRLLRCWQRGETGYPLIDAGMRELWSTGYMHNRVRMVVGSFLVKNLMQHWRHGADWFWDCLVDADLANNTCSWQWVAGCGADAAPYFRIFNPVTQSLKFDAEAKYIKHYLPELADVPAKHIHDIGNAPETVLAAANVKLGSTYPKPIVDLRQSRERALEAYKSLRE